MEKNKINLLLDCDPGHDDAIAILLAGLSKKINLLGIVCSSGNQTLEKTGRNALNLVQFLNLDIKVALGVNHPIIKDVEICDRIHGESGLDGYIFESLHLNFVKKNGILFLIDTILNNRDVTVVVTGPLTNLALALRLEPSIKNNIKEIVIMGGSMGMGNVTPASEFNILCDPEAAHIVYNSGINIKMIGLDVTRKVLVTKDIMKRFYTLNNKYGDLFIKLMTFFNKTQKEVFNLEGAPLHDPATIVSLLDENVIQFKKMHVDIDISHLSSYGRTNCDKDDYLKLEKNIHVAQTIDVKKYWDVIFNTFNI